MARIVAIVCLVAILALAHTDSAAAHKGKKKYMSKGKGVSVSYTTQCDEVCGQKCHAVPRKVCAPVEVPYKDCDKVPVTTSVQKCNKVCTKTTTHVSPVVTHVPKHYGKGRLLLGVGKGKGYVHAAPKVDCDVVCHEVPVTTFKVVCDIKTRITTSCHKEMDTVCNQVCRPVCHKVPVVVEHAPVVHQPVVASKGKGGFSGHGGYNGYNAYGH